MNRLVMLLFFGFFISGMTQAAITPSSGTLHFYGAIVEDACSLTTTLNGVKTQCFRGGIGIVQNHVMVSRNLPDFSLPMSLGQVTTRHVNNDPHLAIMTVTYN